jgi:ABC-type branched-subunit amino acid transport system ATPase component/predicted MFS family arabinose efflux permease
MPTLAELHPQQQDPASLAAGVLRDDEHVDPHLDEPLLDSALRGDEEAPERRLRDIVRVGGTSTLLVLVGLNTVDELDRVAIATLGPDIQKTFGISDAALGALVSVGGLAVFAGAIPLGFLADRIARRGILGVSTLIWAAAAALGGLTATAWQLAATRLINGIGKGTEPVQRSLLSDTYPIDGRGRIFGLHSLANPIGAAIGPVVAGGIAVLIGGTEGWRVALAVLAVPAVVLALLAFRLPEPQRGRFESEAVLGVSDDADVTAAATASGPADGGVSFSAAFDRLKKIRSYYAIMCALGALGVAVAGTPAVVNLLLEDQYGLNAFERGLVSTGTFVGGAIGAVIGGQQADRLFRKDPAKIVTLVGLAIAVFGTLYPIGLFLPNAIAYTAYNSVLSVLVAVPITASTAVVAAIVPPRLRGIGFAMSTLYLVLVGGLGGALLTGALSDALGERTSLVVVMPLSAITAGLYLLKAARHVRRDISLVVEEILEEQEEQRRVREHGEGALLQARGIDFSYGKVQVLFDCSIDVYRGEVLALLGTNGAGKSTLLKVISGLGLPERGVIRLDGSNITYLEAEDRVARGIVQLPGGKAIFPGMTVGENLLVGAHSYVWDRDRVQDKLAEVLDLFPRLAERIDQQAGSLSGGEQQQLALAKALLLDPVVLCIDELSLGLAPVVIQDLLRIIEQLKERGQTMVIVEQSLNVALSIADRAVFMEKGQVRFQGPAQELLERDDLVRAVFLGTADEQG